jgi:hypothetical protein
MQATLVPRLMDQLQMRAPPRQPLQVRSIQIRAIVRTATGRKHECENLYTSATGQRGTCLAVVYRYAHAGVCRPCSQGGLYRLTPGASARGQVRRLRTLRSANIRVRSWLQRAGASAFHMLASGRSEDVGRSHRTTDRIGPLAQIPLADEKRSLTDRQELCRSSVSFCGTTVSRKSAISAFQHLPAGALA